MNIGQVAKQVGFSAKMIRHYESIGLLPEIGRTDAGYRIYTAQHIQTLLFIAHAKSLRFSSEQIKGLLALWQNKDRQSAQVKTLALAHIEQLNQQIIQLKNMVSVLEQVTSCCQGNEQAPCPILDNLEQGLGADHK